MLDSKVLNTDYDLAEMSDLQRPNLLDNADFKSGIINQRGFTTETLTGWSEKGTIDRWIFSGSGNATATVDDTKVSISGDSSLIQTLNKVAPIGTYTLATTIESLSGTLKVGLIFLDDSSETVDVESTGLFVHTFTTTKAVKSVIFRCYGAESSFSFSGAKLEQGSVFTGMPVWNESIEMLKCRRYLYTIGGAWGNMFFARADETHIYVYIPIPTPMEKTPTLITYGGTQPTSKSLIIYLNSASNGIDVSIDEFTQSINNVILTLVAPLNGRAKVGRGSAIFRFTCALCAEE